MRPSYRVVVLLLALTIPLFGCGPQPDLRRSNVAGTSASVQGSPALIPPSSSTVGTPTPLPTATIRPLVSAPAVGSGPSRFTGSFMVDGRPTWLGFLRLTQTGATVTGYLLVVQPGNQGATAGQTVSVQGNTDDDAITPPFFTAWLGIRAAI